MISSQSINILKNAPSVASTVGQNIAFLAANGAVPWLNTLSTAVKPSVTQRYQNKAAPHIIFFLVDDWGYNDCGYQSSWLNWTTPNIDKLMHAGVRFTHYYTHELCGPSRAALLTGRYAARFGMNGDTQDIVELPHSEFTLGQEMQSAGYRTNLIGK